MRIGLLGCGTIGSAIAEALAKPLTQDLKLVLVVDQMETEPIHQILSLHHCAFSNKPEDLASAQLEWVIEAAGQEAARQYVLFLLDHRLNVLLMSVGALVDENLLNQMRQTALARQCRVRIPSGAIGGLDALRSAHATGSLQQVLVTTTKPPPAWEGAPYLVQNHIDLSRISSPTILYDGSAAQAVTAFPKNVNVVASVSLAGIGFQRTQVRAIADPSIKENIHNVQARGAFGELEITLRNIPSPQNPRTSILASSSAIAACLSLPDPIQIGVG